MSSQSHSHSRVLLKIWEKSFFNFCLYNFSKGTNERLYYGCGGGGGVRRCSLPEWRVSQLNENQMQSFYYETQAELSWLIQENYNIRTTFDLANNWNKLDALKSRQNIVKLMCLLPNSPPQKKYGNLNSYQFRNNNSTQPTNTNFLARL